MNHAFHVTQIPAIPIPLLGRVLPALVRLWRRHASAEEAHRDTWEFAVPGQFLTSFGLSRHEIDWLLNAEFIVVRRSQGNDIGTPLHGVSLEGLDVVISEFAATLVASINDACEVDLERGNSGVTVKPYWDAARRELWFDGILLKRFKKPGPNQELILAAFERQGWPKRIDDPLPFKADISPVDRLHDAVKRLTRSLDVPLVKFGGDGKGSGARWRPVSPPPEDGI